MAIKVAIEKDKQFIPVFDPTTGIFISHAGVAVLIGGIARKVIFKKLLENLYNFVSYEALIEEYTGKFPEIKNAKDYRSKKASLHVMAQRIRDDLIGSGLTIEAESLTGYRLALNLMEM